MLPTGVGEPKVLFQDSINHLSARWLPDGKHLVFSGSEPGHGFRFYIQAIDDNKPHPISPEGISTAVVLSPHGDVVASTGPDRRIYLYPVSGGDPVAVHGPELDEVPTGWSADGKSLYVYKFGEVPARVFQINLATGERKPWKQLSPADSAGIDTIRGIDLSSDGSSYVYGYIRTLSDLYLVEGLK
jgi:Tol biopolymer transport system component